MFKNNPWMMKEAGPLFTTGSDGRARLKETTNDPSDRIEAGAIKYDTGKAAVFRGAIGYFPRALERVAAVSTFGATKYAWRGWESVSDGFNRYSDALARHLLAEARGESTDNDSGLEHAAHAAWNALARLELMLKEQENNGPVEAN